MHISRFTWILFFSTLTCFRLSIAQHIVINEFMADNESTVQDEDGDFSDWIELYNPEPTTINLNGYHLTDDKKSLQKWTFPDIEIGPNEFLIIFASGKDKHTESDIHTNFKISDDGENLILSNSLEIKLDEFSKVELGKDKSFGRLPDGSSNKVSLPSPSPGNSNNIINKLLFSYPAGFYESDIDLSINSLLGDSIYYTIDGSEPTTQSLVYTSKLRLKNKSNQPNIWSEIPTTPSQELISNPAWKSPGYLIDKANIVRCASFKNNAKTSDTYSQTYIIAEDVFEKYDLPIISLITNANHFFDHDNGIYIPGMGYDSSNPEWTGNYFIDEIESERPIHIEFFEKDGKLGFSQNAGVRIHGGKTRHAAQKSLKLYSRDEYGKRFFKYPLMPQNGVDKYERFVLQTTMAAWGGETVIKDILAHEIVKEMDLEKMDYRPVVVFLNGEYWGIHHIRDRVDEEYLSYTTGLDKDSLEIDRIGNTHFFALIDYFKDHVPIDDDEYEYIVSQMDIGGFIDYNIAEMFLSNYDWPSNNSRHWRPKKVDGKWRWIFFDLDGGFTDPTYNMLIHNTNIDSTINWPNSAKSTFFFRSLIENDIFLDQFLSRYKELLEQDFRPSITKEKLVALVDQYKYEMPEHSKRWHFPESYDSWLDDIDIEIRDFLDHRPCIVVEHIEAFFNLSDYEVMCKDSTDFIIEPNKKTDLTIAPNPNQGNFSIINPNQNKYKVNIKLYNMLGQPYYNQDDLIIEPNRNYNLEFNHLESGVYSLIIQQENKIKSIPLIVIRQ